MSDYKKSFYDILDQITEIAVATSVDNIPSVRIMSFCYAQNRNGVLYIQSKSTSKKVADFAANSKVAFATQPIGKSITHIKSVKADVIKSKHSFDDLKDLFIEKAPEYREVYLANVSALEVFEIHCKEALVVVDYGNYGFAGF